MLLVELVFTAAHPVEEAVRKVLLVQGMVVVILVVLCEVVVEEQTTKMAEQAADIMAVAVHRVLLPLVVDQGMLERRIV